MSSGLRSPGLVWVATLVLGGCGGLEGPPLPVSSASPVRAAVEEGSLRAAGNPVGAFRTQPAADGDRITVPLGESVDVNGARFVPADPGDELKVEVEWGDGTADAVGCGPCRLSHVYRGRGTYVLTATIHNRRNVERGSVTQTFQVDVQGPAPTDSGPQLHCHSINAVSGVGTQPPVPCPSGATQFCDTKPIVATSSAQARLACEACAGPGVACIASGGVFDGPHWFFQVPWIAGKYLYAPDPPGTGTKTPGDISFGVQAKGRWAP